MLVSEKRPQITQDLGSSFKCTGCNTTGAGDTGTGVLFLVHCKTTNLYCSKFSPVNARKIAINRRKVGTTWSTKNAAAAPGHAPGAPSK